MRTYLVETKFLWKFVQITTKKLSKFTKNFYTYRWYDDTQSCKISCPRTTSFVWYKNNKFLTNHLDNLLAWNLLFLYLTNEVESGQDILQGCVSSYHLHVWFFVNLDDFFAVVCMGFHEHCGFHQIRSHFIYQNAIMKSNDLWD